jgi:hypothetical protein
MNADTVAASDPILARRPGALIVVTPAVRRREITRSR